METKSKTQTCREFNNLLYEIMLKLTFSTTLLRLLSLHCFGKISFTMSLSIQVFDFHFPLLASESRMFIFFNSSSSIHYFYELLISLLLLYFFFIFLSVFLNCKFCSYYICKILSATFLCSYRNRAVSTL